MSAQIQQFEQRSRKAQPLEAAKNPAALLRIETVVALTGISRSSIYTLIAAGRFVQPVRLSARCTRYRAGDVAAWLASK